MAGKHSLRTDICGDAVVEAAILFPFMILVFAALTFLAIYLPARSALQRATQYAATALATERSDSWIISAKDSGLSEWAETKRDLPGIYEAIFSGPGDMQQKGSSAVALIESRNLSSKAGKLDVECHLVNNIIYKEIVVTAKREFTMPIDLSIFGIQPEIPIVVTSTAVVQNADELIRNLDLSIDFAWYIMEKFGLADVAESIGAFGERVASILGLTG